MRGVIVSSVESRTPASVAGLRVGDIVTALGPTEIGSVFEFYGELNGTKGDVDLHVWRDGETETMTIVR